MYTDRDTYIVPGVAALPCVFWRVFGQIVALSILPRPADKDGDTSDLKEKHAEDIKNCHTQGTLQRKKLEKTAATT